MPITDTINSRKLQHRIAAELWLPYHNHLLHPKLPLHFHNFRHPSISTPPCDYEEWLDKMNSAEPAHISEEVATRTPASLLALPTELTKSILQYLFVSMAFHIRETGHRLFQHIPTSRPKYFVPVNDSSQKAFRFFMARGTFRSWGRRAHDPGEPFRGFSSTR